MLGFARKSLDRTRTALLAFAAVGPLVQAIHNETAPPLKMAGDPFVFPVTLLFPIAALFFGVAALSDEREGGAMEFALSLPITGNALLARLFAAGALPLALLAPVLWAEAKILGDARGNMLEWGGPLDLAMLIAWPYAAGFLAALIVDRFAAALGLAVVLFAGSEFVAGLFAPELAWRWLAFTLYALFVAQRLFAPPGFLEPRMHAVRSAAGLAGFGILAFCLGRLFLFV